MAKEYNIRKTSGQCSACEAKLEPDTELTALVREGKDELIREDFCNACWAESPKEEEPGVLCVWHTRVPIPSEKKKLLIDDGLLKNLFERLADSEEPSKINFRYVLGLVLMRKRLLVYDRSEKDDEGQEVWQMHFRGDKETVRKVIDPNLSEDQIAEVSANLGDIMEGDF